MTPQAGRAVYVKAMPGVFEGVRWGRLVCGVLITTVLGLSVHAVMLQVLHVPYPSAALDSKLPEVLNGAVMMWAAIWLYDGLRTWRGDRAARVRVVMLFMLLAGLNGTVRGALMNGYCSTQAPVRWLIALLLMSHYLIYYVVVAGFAAGMSRLRSDSARLAGVAAGALLAAFFLTPGLATLDAAIGARVAHWITPGGWCELPYGMDVLLPAYATFLEPVLACLICVALIWRCLPARPVGRIAAFVLLILALKRQLLMPFLYAAFVPGPAATAFASMGQFSLEAVALGALTAINWYWSGLGQAHSPR